MEDSMPTALVAGALDLAVEPRGGRVAGVIFHSDRGSQYLSDRFRARSARLRDLPVRRPGGHLPLYRLIP
jgi:transposase InsO family protein